MWGRSQAGRVRQQQLGGVGEADPGLPDVHRLLAAKVAPDVVQDDGRQLGGEGEPLVAVARLGHGEQTRGLRAVADHRGQRGAGLSGQGQRDEDQRPVADVHVPDGAARLGGAPLDGEGPGEGG